MTVTYNYTDGASIAAGAYVAQLKAPEVGYLFGRCYLPAADVEVQDPFPSEIKIYGDFTATFAKFVEIAGPPPSI